MNHCVIRKKHIRFETKSEIRLLLPFVLFLK